MAAYISVPRDFSKVKSKVAFNLTARQLICFGAAAVVGVPLFFVLRDTAGNSGATLGMMVVMLPMPNNEILEELFQMFNLSRPQDFEGHSLSVSDVIALKRNGEVSVHYVDSIGFKDLQGFLDKQPERPSVLLNLKEKCDAPECNPTACRKARDEHEL